MKNEIIVIGDIHNAFHNLNSFINDKKPKLILSTGDFGYWPRAAKPVYDRHFRDIRRQKLHSVDIIKTQNCQIRFCDGNHEDHESLLKLENYELAPNVFYQPRGSIHKLQDNRNILFMGGADSIDKDERTLGYDYFKEEIITIKDLDNIPKNTRIDIVISHTCPDELVPEMLKYNNKRNDPSTKALSIILEQYRPKLWYFGHWHTYKKGIIKDCKWTCLNQEGQTGWWTRLD
jgi:predicted phosphodiesterase